MSDHEGRSDRLDRAVPRRRGTGAAREHVVRPLVTDAGEVARDVGADADDAAVHAGRAISCPRCGATRALTARLAVRLLLPPTIVDPMRARLRARCPSCGRRAWLAVSTGGRSRS